MHHLSAYHITGVAAPIAFVDVPAVPDPAITIVNNHPIFQSAIQLLLGHAFGDADLTEVKVQTPKVRAIQVPSMRPLDCSTLPQTRPPVDYWLRHPLSLNPIDENQVLMSAGGSASDYYAGLWFGDGNMNVPPGDVFTARGTAVITGVTNQWASGPFILDSPLPAGIYAVIGFDAFGTNAAYMRLIFPNQVWRPGIIAGQDATFINCPSFRFGQLGTFGTFSSYAQPNLDLLCVGACTAQEIYLDIVKVA